MAEARATVAGAERIGDAFASAREQGRAALMPYLMGAYPDAAGGVAVAKAYADAGADLIELGIPFSDPLADGPVIHAAATAALDAGASVDSALEACAAVSDRVPVVTMVYSNMILAGGGPEAFAERIAAAGAAGAIVPDLPIEEAGDIHAALSRAGLALVPLIAPTTPRRAAPRDLRGGRGLRLPRLDGGGDGRARRAAARAHRVDRGRALGRRGPGRGRVRDRHARAGREQSVGSPTGSSSAAASCARSRTLRTSRPPRTASGTCSARSGPPWGPRAERWLTGGARSGLRRSSPLTPQSRTSTRAHRR